MSKRKAFTLVELLIVVSILGVLAAIIMPEFRGHGQQAKESAAKEMLQMLRGQIELYAIQHKGIPPGYLNGDMSSNPIGTRVVAQLTQVTNLNGEWEAPGTAGYDYGPYMHAMPKNPFNGSDRVWIVSDNPKVTELSVVGETYGWQYHGPTKTINLNTTGNDSVGVIYLKY